MPGRGRIVERAYTRSEREALGAAVPVMSEEGDFGTPPGHSQERGPFKGPVGAGLKPAPTPSIQGAPWDHAGTRAVGDGFRVKPGMTEEGAGLGETTFDVYLNDRAYWRNRARGRLELQAGRLPGAQEVALLPRAQHPGPPAPTQGSAALHRHRKADRGYSTSGSCRLNRYKDTTFWENQRRLRELNNFHSNVISYFDGPNGTSAIARQNEGGESGKCRQDINLSIIEVRDIVKASGVADMVAWTPPPAIGGNTQRVGLFDDLFYLKQYEIPASSVVDVLERSIGVYIADQRNSLWRTLNPVWWIFKAVKWLSRIPFILIDAAGFDADRAEHSVPGRLFKMATASIMVAAALLTILDLIGWLDAAMEMVGIAP